MPYKKHQDWFPVYLHDYRVTIEKIVPSDLQSQDDGLVDDLHHALDLRSKLEEELEKRPRLEKYRRDIEQIDKALLAQRDRVLEIVGDGLVHSRKIFSPLPSHWWWYLDQSEGETSLERKVN